MVRAMASEAEVLQHRDVATLDAAEKRRLAAMFVRLSLHPPVRRTARHRRWHRGELDASRTLRDSLRRMGEPGEIAWRRRGTPAATRGAAGRRQSGSMSAVRRRAAAAGAPLDPVRPPRPGRRVETFTVGTRLTHVTRALRPRTPTAPSSPPARWCPTGPAAPGSARRCGCSSTGGASAGWRAVPWSSSSATAGSAATPALLGEQMARLQRIAHRVVWVNPHRGKAGYEPVQRGVVAALPHCDDFLAGHSLATFADLTEVIARA